MPWLVKVHFSYIGQRFHVPPTQTLKSSFRSRSGSKIIRKARMIWLKIRNWMLQLSGIRIACTFKLIHVIWYCEGSAACVAWVAWVAWVAVCLVTAYACNTRIQVSIYFCHFFEHFVAFSCRVVQYKNKNMNIRTKLSFSRNSFLFMAGILLVASTFHTHTA